MHHLKSSIHFVHKKRLNACFPLKDIEPFLGDLEKTLNINVTDIETVHVPIEEIGDIKQMIECSNCHHPMQIIECKRNLVNCKKCSKYSLVKSFNLEASISMTLSKMVS